MLYYRFTLLPAAAAPCMRNPGLVIPPHHCYLLRKGRSAMCVFLHAADTSDDDPIPVDDEKYEDLLISVVNQIVTILIESDPDDVSPDP